MKTNIQLSHISTTCLLRMLLRNLWMILATALIFSMCTSLYLSWIFVPKYQATMTYAVTSRRTSYATSGNQSATREVAAVLTEMLETDMVADNIRAHSPELENFNGTITASQVGESNMIVVNSVADTPEEAFLSICAVEDNFPIIVGYLSNSSVVQVIRNPSVSSAPVNQVNTRQTTRTAALVGALGMAALLCWFSISRETVQTTTGARHLLDAHIISIVNRVPRKWTFRSLLHPSDTPLQVFSPTTSFSFNEQINAICTHMEQEASTSGRKIFMITGVGENEGKSTISGNVAAALAMMGKKVAVLDCDLRNPSLNRFFGGKYVSPIPLNKLLGLPFSKENLLQCMMRHEQLGLYMLFATQPDRRCTELLTSQTMDALLNQLRIFDYVILDTPPMGYFTDTEALMDRVDASMLVVRQDYTPACDINDAADLLRHARSHFMGVVLNDMTYSLTEGHRSGYGYGYGAHGYGAYGYGKSSGRKHE